AKVVVTNVDNGCKDSCGAAVTGGKPTLNDTCGSAGPITSGFELDGNAVSNAPNPPDDWDLVAALSSSATSTTGLLTDLNSKADDYFKIGTKDLDSIKSWHWNKQTTPDKDDLLNGGAAQYGNRLYFFADRFAVNGDAQIGFWFLQNGVDTATGGTFLGEHV